MDADQLRELATSALTGHWPPHLGVNTDQEKIEYLASQLEAVANEIRDADELEEKLGDAEENYSETLAELANIETCAECALCDQHEKVKTQ